MKFLNISPGQAILIDRILVSIEPTVFGKQQNQFFCSVMVQKQVL